MTLIVKKKTIFWSLIIICLFPPAYFTRIDVISTISNLLLLIISVGVVIYSIRNNVMLDHYLMVLLIFVAYLLVVTVIRNGNLVNAVTQAIRIFLICYLCSRVIDIDSERMLNAFYIVFTAYMVINTFTVFAFPDALYANWKGEYKMWFLGEDNVAYAWYLFGNVVAITRDLRNKGKVSFSSVFSLTLSFVLVFWLDIGTGKLCSIVFVFLIMMSYFKAFRDKFSMPLCVSLHGIYFILVVILQITVRMSDLIYKLFGRSSTLSGRVNIWNVSIRLILKKFVFGYGIYTGNEFQAISGITNGKTPHNLYLWFVFWGGIIALIILVVAILMAGQMNKYRDYGSTLILSGLFVYMLRMQSESLPFDFLFLILMFYANYEKLVLRTPMKKQNRFLI